MNCRQNLFIVSVFVVLAALDAPSARAKPAESEQRDVLIYGATPSGIAAAVSAAKSGSSVLLVEPTSRIGGMQTCGLSNTDFRTFESLTGFFLDFNQRVQKYYDNRYGADSSQSKAAFRGTHGEPSVNLLVLQAMIDQHPSIDVVLRHRLVNVHTERVGHGRTRITSADFVSPESEGVSLSATYFIDTSYEGDLMAMAGESYHVGRESRQQYGEPMAGNEFGQADGQVQGYNLRLIMTTNAGNSLEPVEPFQYDREQFVGVLAHFESGNLKRVFSPDRDGIFRAHQPWLPNLKADINDTPHAKVRLSMPDINDDYPEGDQATRNAIIAQHYQYNLGLLYFLQTDDAVPMAIRADANRWKFCRDEFVETNGIPPQLYIRESRRLIGQHVYTADDTRQADGDARSVFHADSIAIGDVVHNCHGTGRKGSRFDGEHTGEFYDPVPPYQIPYGVIVPAKNENLLVPVACSASHFGFAAIRMEPIWCGLGQAAGHAITLANQQGIAVQDIDVKELQKQLHKDGSATIYVSDVPPSSPDFIRIQTLGMQGKLHGRFGADQPKVKKLDGRYEAFAGHSAPRT